MGHLAEPGASPRLNIPKSEWAQIPNEWEMKSKRHIGFPAPTIFSHMTHMTVPTNVPSLSAVETLSFQDIFSIKTSRFRPQAFSLPPSCQLGLRHDAQDRWLHQSGHRPWEVVRFCRMLCCKICFPLPSGIQTSWQNVLVHRQTSPRKEKRSNLSWKIQLMLKISSL